jgi:hypothetical protein
MGKRESTEVIAVSRQVLFSLLAQKALSLLRQLSEL